jgi:hypothetical protein
VHFVGFCVDFWLPFFQGFFLIILLLLKSPSSSSSSSYAEKMALSNKY